LPFCIFRTVITTLEEEKRVHQPVGVALKFLPGPKTDVAGSGLVTDRL
jgi:hypothetical protein